MKQIMMNIGFANFVNLERLTGDQFPKRRHFQMSNIESACFHLRQADQVYNNYDSNILFYLPCNRRRW